MRVRHLVALVAVVAACDGSSVTEPMRSDGAAGTVGSGGVAASGGAAGTGGASATGGSMASGGTSGSATGTGGRTGGTGEGGMGGAGGARGSGGRTGRGGDAGVDVGKFDGAAGGAGGVGGTGGAKTDAGIEVVGDVTPDGLSDGSADARPDGGADMGSGSGSDATTRDGDVCPYSGNVSYTLAQRTNPSTTEQQAYSLITKAMDEAVDYYNCYTNISKKLNVSYDTSVSTADGNVNGSIRFGAGTQYMVNYTAMHEIAHTVGVGQYASPNWMSFIDIPSGGSNGPWTGTNATAELRAITGNPTDTLTADHDHFWPYGLNKSTDPHAPPDLVAHCRIVMALRKDLGLQ